MENLVISFIKESEDKYIEEFTKGNYYNIFNELSIYADEVKHSSYLKSFIDPNGFHGCGHHFFDSFIKNIEIDSNDDEFSWLKDYEDINVYVEYFIGNRDYQTGNYIEDFYGRIDLLIEHSKKNKAIVIENKIYAKDQPQQLKRYYDFSTKKYGEINKDFWLYYLTLDNKEPSVQSYEGVRLVDIRCISYQNHILKWIEISLTHFGLNENVFSSLKQYAQIIHQITNQSLDINATLLKQEKYSSLTTTAIIGKRDDLRKEFFIELFNCLKQQLPNSQISFVAKIHEPINDINSSLAPNNHIKNIGICIDNTINIEIQDWTRLIYGVFDPINKNAELCKKMEVLGFIYKPWWLLKEYPIKNSKNISFGFYDDKLNFTFLTENKSIAAKFSDEIVQLVNEVCKTVQF